MNLASCENPALMQKACLRPLSIYFPVRKQRAQPFLQVSCQWDLGPNEESLLTSLVFAGMCVGTVIWGLLSDTRGRRTTFLASAALVCLAGAISAAAPNYYVSELQEYISSTPAIAVLSQGMASARSSGSSTGNTLCLGVSNCHQTSNTNLLRLR